MPQYGNSAGRNKGKKYIKLTGNEIATPEAEQRAKRFIDWYGAMCGYIARSIRDHNEDVATDTMLQVYNDILYKGTHVKNYRAYFMRAYHTTKLKRAMEDSKRRGVYVPLEDEAAEVPASDFDYELYEGQVEQLHAEMLDHVRGHFEPMEVSIFEIYVGLQPNVSYATMGAMLGISANRIYLIISAIKRDLQANFAERRNYLLSIV